MFAKEDRRTAIFCWERTDKRETRVLLLQILGHFQNQEAKLLQVCSSYEFKSYKTEFKWATNSNFQCITLSNSIVEDSHMHCCNSQLNRNWEIGLWSSYEANVRHQLSKQRKIEVTRKTIITESSRSDRLILKTWITVHTTMSHYEFI